VRNEWIERDEDTPYEIHKQEEVEAHFAAERAKAMRADSDARLRAARYALVIKDLTQAVQRLLREHDVVTIQRGGHPGERDWLPEAAGLARHALRSAAQVMPPN
jgi:hypothetical protein